MTDYQGDRLDRRPRWRRPVLWATLAALLLGVTALASRDRSGGQTPNALNPISASAKAIRIPAVTTAPPTPPPPPPPPPGGITHGNQLTLAMVGAPAGSPKIGPVVHRSGTRTISNTVIEGCASNRYLTEVTGGTLILSNVTIRGTCGNNYGVLVDGGAVQSRRLLIEDVGIGFYGIAGSISDTESWVYNLWGCNGCWAGGAGPSHNEAIKGVNWGGAFTGNFVRGHYEGRFGPRSTGGGMSAAVHMDTEACCGIHNFNFINSYFRNRPDHPYTLHYAGVRVQGQVVGNQLDGPALTQFGGVITLFSGNVNQAGSPCGSNPSCGY